MVGIVWRNDHSNDRCNILRTEIGVSLASKGLDFFQPFLRGFVTVERRRPVMGDWAAFLAVEAEAAAKASASSAKVVSIGSRQKRP